MQGCQRTKKGWLVTLTSDTLKDLLELRCVDYVARINSHHKIFVGCKKKLWCSCKSLQPVLEYFYITKMTAIDHILPLFLLIVFLLLTNAWYINKVIRGHFALISDFWFLLHITVSDGQGWQRKAGRLVKSQLWGHRRWFYFHFNSFLVACIVSACLIFVNFGTSQNYLGL